jgi:hypothetical protein
MLTRNFDPNYAIQFGEGVDKGLESQKVFPFFYPFVNSEDDDWDINKGAGTIGNLSDIGPTVPSGGRVRYSMKLEPDYMWKLLSFKYTTYYLNQRAELNPMTGTGSIAAGSDNLVGAGGSIFLTELIPGDTVQIGGNDYRIESITNDALAIIKDADIPAVAEPAGVMVRLAWNKYMWYEEPTGFFLEQGDYQTAIGTPLLRYITVSVWFATPQNIYLYGGINQDAQTNPHGDVIPVNVKSVQGYDYGFGQLFSDFLLPREGNVFFDINNNHPVKDLVVGCTARGLKIRV